MTRPYRTFSAAALEKAANAVKRGKSYRAAEKLFGVPKSSIQRHISGKQQGKCGRPPVFTPEEEGVIAECLGLAADWGFPLTKRDLKYIVQRFLDSKGVQEPRFENNRPGSRWTKSFLSRLAPSIKDRLSHNIKRSRAAVTPAVIEAYFSELSVSLKDISPEALINYDETSMQDDPGKEKVIIRRQCKYPDRIIDSSKSNISVMFGGTASGVCLPPYVVYKSQRVHGSWVVGGPPNTRYNHSASGWFESSIFEDWFESIALKYFKGLGDCQKAVIGDNLASHLSVKVLKLCMENNVRFLLLPPNSTHLCQPLDLAFFSPLKNAWRKVLLDWKMKRKGTLRKDHFPLLLKQTLDSMGPGKISENMKAGFAASGLFPLDKQRVLNRLPKPRESEPVEVEERGPEWTRAFTDYLKETREKETVVNPRRKKINVIPGKSVACEEILDQIQNSQKNKNENQKEMKKRGRKKNEVGKKEPPRKVPRGTTRQKTARPARSDSETSSEESSYDVPVVDTDDDMDPPSPLYNCSEAGSSEAEEDPTTTPNTNEENSSTQPNTTSFTSPIPDENQLPSTSGSSSLNVPAVDDFVLVEYLYDEGTKKENIKNLLGKVVAVSPNGEKFTITFMRNYKGKKEEYYCFPPVEDIDDVPSEKIKRILKPLILSRGRYIFIF